MTKLETLVTGLYLSVVVVISCNKNPMNIENINAVAADKNALAIIFAAGDDANSVKKDVGLPTSGANGSSISWATSNSSVITTEGVVTRPDSSSGDAIVTLTATILKGTASDSKVFLLTVYAKGTRISVFGVILKSNTIIQVDATEQLLATIVPETATNKAVRWVSSAVSIATVSSSGYVTGVSEGKSIITVTTVDGNFTSQCEVTVIKKGSVTVTDIDGNVYMTVKIGDQVWMAENLRVTKYNDGTAIPNNTDDDSWNTMGSPAYCYYNNTTNPDTIKKFGALYNWYVIKTKRLAPIGWHVPTETDWEELEYYLEYNGYAWDDTSTGNQIAKSLAAQTDWLDHFITGTIGCDLAKNNKSGFSALPGGYRLGQGNFYGLNYSGYWWSANEVFDGISDVNAYCHMLDCTGSSLNIGSHYKGNGYSVRLIRN